MSLHTEEVKIKINQKLEQKVVKELNDQIVSGGVTVLYKEEGEFPSMIGWVKRVFALGRKTELFLTVGCYHGLGDHSKDFKIRVSKLSGVNVYYLTNYELSKVKFVN